jgi:hypothetical protein
MRPRKKKKKKKEGSESIAQLEETDRYLVQRSAAIFRVLHSAIHLSGLFI